MKLFPDGGSFGFDPPKGENDFFGDDGDNRLEELVESNVEPNGEKDVVGNSASLSTETFDSDDGGVYKVLLEDEALGLDPPNGENDFFENCPFVVSAGEVVVLSEGADLDSFSSCCLRSLAYMSSPLDVDDDGSPDDLSDNVGDVRNGEDGC